MKITVIGGGPGGLYAAILMKKQWPDYDITVYERNAPDSSFGFGVVFSDETLGFLDDYDNPSYEAIRRSFAYWDNVDVHFKGEVIRCAGNGFCGCSRLTLLQILQDRCQEVGVHLNFNTEIESVDQFSDSDLIIAADGIGSFIREQYKDWFQPQVDLRRNYFCWLGSSRELDAFKYFFRETQHGPVVSHSYQYEPGRSTWVIEMPPETWEGFGFGQMLEEEYTKVIEDIFAEELDGHSFITNRSLWRRFPAIRNKHWVKDNIVLLGDSQHTAHYSIGSGTKLAMESAIALFEAMKTNSEVPAALTAFERDRRTDVEVTQHAADVSLSWFENMGRYWDMEPLQFAFGCMSRSKKLTYENLRLRDQAFVDQCTEVFNRQVQAAGFDVDTDTPPMFTPFQLREMTLDNRVVLSPMAQYKAQDGVPNEWHFVHYASRAIGGAALVYTEMTCPSPDARITPGCTGLWNEEQRDAFKRIVDFAHNESRAKMCMQLGHAGRKGSTQLGWDKMDHPLPEGNWPIYSASPIPYLPESQVPIELTREHMDQVVSDFARSARYADEAGFDMLELHMAHGYLLASFISPLTNQRKDEYGGSLENRLRFPREVFHAVREVWPAEKPMSIRVSGGDWHEGGLTTEDLKELAVVFRDAGVDLIDVSAGQTVADQKPVYGRMFQTPFSDLVRNEAGVSTITVGNITSADQVNTILVAGRADLVAMARPHLSDPYFTLRSAAWYEQKNQFWPKPYLAGKFQLLRQSEKERDELVELKTMARPRSHEVIAPNEKLEAGVGPAKISS
ncbi:bifunctional salicylyl-CoA 5-hydroxylase/oxidoreductase [Marinobacter orientalis]|uniref:Bifunctional salicylyl-CoA 5-hydroxylase/oxidoreductase n=1 Tax=Marinobacter orientalis TaxID=1928859 RepID=A0A7Y0RAB8_9GAMM|nr:bifunctional salicylyl-CoA 5-hydroxylase/oxidoreductase [Marinobacter orientalis]NMT62714.1 bifunctional salicylyl-CoA 5-hydroxylase/oxidoreductase [Marinobacter orientalis]TGX51398.1 bifunctional salicylyl-CoA 5-hydroxylase/oxidoreductase [Marinobacter orientalis]